MLEMLMNSGVEASMCLGMALEIGAMAGLMGCVGLDWSLTKFLTVL